MVHIPPQSRISKIGDYLMLPLMYLLQGTLSEQPQATHRWNNIKFKNNELAFLVSERMANIAGDTSATRRWWWKLPIFHIPLFGGWKKFVVVQPEHGSVDWFIGWVAGDVSGVSQIPLRGPVRVLLGRGPAQFFGLDGSGQQMTLLVVGHGRIGEAGKFAHVPLR